MLQFIIHYTIHYIIHSIYSILVQMLGMSVVYVVCLEYMYECVYTTPEMSKLQPAGKLKDPQTNKHLT